MSAKGRARAARKVKIQKINKTENERYYQNGSKQKWPRSDGERAADRRVD